MKAKSIRSAAVCCAIAAGVAATPMEYSSGNLLEDCQAAEESLDSIPASRCVYYISGFLDANRMQQRMESFRTVWLPFGSRAARIPSGKSDRDCPRENIAVDEIIGLLAEFSQSGLDDFTVSPAELLQRVLSEHYPCERNAS